MTRALAAGLFVVLLGACRSQVSPQLTSEWQNRTLYTCCNLRYEGGEINDANYGVGSMLPFGSAATVLKASSGSITFRAGGGDLTLYHKYGTAQETSQQYFGKILVDADPHVRFATYPAQVQSAITDGRIERGMTKEQVIMSIGYPPSHRTTSTEMNTWIYFYNRWITYQVQFGADGKLSNIVGRAPTRNEPIVAPTPTPAKPARKGGKYK